MQDSCGFVHDGSREIILCVKLNYKRHKMKLELVQVCLHFAIISTFFTRKTIKVLTRPLNFPAFPFKPFFHPQKHV